MKDQVVKRDKTNQICKFHFPKVGKLSKPKLGFGQPSCGYHLSPSETPQISVTLSSTSGANLGW